MVSFIDSLRRRLPSLEIVQGEGLRDYFVHVWTTDIKVKCLALLLPRNVEEISIILNHCSKGNQPVVVHGGLTNLVSSTHSNEDEVVISMKYLNEIVDVDPISRCITVEAGVILEDVLTRSDELGLFFPVNYGAKGSAQIGGALSTNAGGTRVMKYGMMREQVMGIEAVLADGTIVSSLKKLLKDNTGLDWKQLMIGTEGIYGVITKAVLRLKEKPVSRASAIIAVDNYDDVIQLLRNLDKGMGGMLSAFELMWQDTYMSLTSPPSIHKPPLPHDYPLYILVEILGGNQSRDQSLFEELIEACLDLGIIKDAAIATSDQELKWFWGIREDVHPLLEYGKHHQTFDISIPIPFIGTVVEETRASLLNCEGVDACFALGHIGDGNIHYIVLKDNDSPPLTNLINQLVYARISELNGSVSAEHGIGIDKLEFLSFSRSKDEIEIMKKIKSVLDPMNILNRGKVIP